MLKVRLELVLSPRLRAVADLQLQGIGSLFLKTLAQG